MEKTERLINLIALLLNVPRPMAVGRIREKIPGYADQSDDAFHRMFERDKNELRELGFALVQDAGAWGEPGYRIQKEDALLEDPGLTPAECAALSLAAQAWGGADGSLGLIKLALVSGVAEARPSGWLLPRVELDRNARTLFDAVARRKRVRFAYRTGGGGESQERDVDPYGLYHRGTWYVGGFDHVRGEVRSFKLSRIDGAVTVTRGRGPDFEAHAPGVPEIRRGPWEGEAELEARVAFAPESAWWAERKTGAVRLLEREDDWVEFSIPVADLGQFAAWIAGFGRRAVAIEPAELRDAVVAHLHPLTGMT